MTRILGAWARLPNEIRKPIRDYAAIFLGLVLAGDAIEEKDARGNAIVDDTVVLLFNAHHESIPFVLPASDERTSWVLMLDTCDPTPRRSSAVFKGGEPYTIEARSMAILCRESVHGA